MTYHPRLKAFLDQLEHAKVGFVQDWFKLAREASAVHKAVHLQQSFMTGAIPEIYNMDSYGAEVCLQRPTSNAYNAGVLWRQHNPPEIVGRWFMNVQYENADGKYTYYSIPKDPVYIQKFIERVIKARRSFA